MVTFSNQTNYIKSLYELTAFSGIWWWTLWAFTSWVDTVRGYGQGGTWYYTGNSRRTILRQQHYEYQVRRRTINQAQTEFMLNFVDNPEKEIRHPQESKMYFICSETFIWKNAIQRPLSPKVNFGQKKAKTSPKKCVQHPQKHMFWYIA